MSISELLSVHQTQLSEVNEKLSEFEYSVTAIELIRDPNLQSQSQNKKPSTQARSGSIASRASANEIEEEDLSGLSISKLNEKQTSAEQNLSELNRLWIIKGLVQEIEVSFDNPIDSEGFKYDQYDLQSILRNLKSLSSKIGQLDDHILIRGSLNKKLSSFNERLNDELIVLARKFTTESLEPGLEEFRFNNRLYIHDDPFTYHEFVSIVDDYVAFSNVSGAKQYLSGLKHRWDTQILDQLMAKKKYISLLESESCCDLTLVEASEPQFFNELYFRSIGNFMKFINAVNDQSFKNYYSNKISNNLSNSISENIIKIYKGGPNSEVLLEQLEDILQLSESTNWQLSISRSFSSSTKINDQLNSFYLDWVVDKYINELRSFYNSDEFDKLLSTLHDESTPQTLASESPAVNNEVDEWNDKWDSENDDEDMQHPEQQHEDQVPDDDGWGDGWDDDWGDEPESPKKNKTQPSKPTTRDKPETTVPSVPSSQPLVKVSRVPAKISEIVSRFHDESNHSANDDPLISTIISFSLLSYPKPGQSFILYNDLKFLSQQLNQPKLDASAESNWSQQTIIFSNDLFKILLSQHVDQDGNDGDDDISREPVELSQWFNSLQRSDLKSTNAVKFKTCIIQFIEVINNWLINLIINLDEITEYQSDKLSYFIKYIQKLTIDNLKTIGEPLTSIRSANKLHQTHLLINNHLKDIMEVFNQGELFDYTTEELIKVIQAVFIKSELRDNYIREIIEIRSIED